MPGIQTVNDGAHDFNGGLKLKLKNEIKGEVKSELWSELKNELNRELHGDFGNGINHQPVQTNGSPKSRSDIPLSIFAPICHPLVDDATRDVDGYYLKYWGFPNEKAKKKFVAAGFSRVTCLYFPKALDERIRFACSLLTILFLIDDQLEDMSLKDGAAYNESLMPLCRGDQLPDRSVPAQWMMYDLWEDMRKCDKALANEVLEPVFMFMRAQTSHERLTVQGLGRYLQYRQDDVGQALLAALMRFSMALHLDAADFASVIEVEKNCGRHISVMNDIYSFEKELLASKTAHKEGGIMCSAVQIFAQETNLSIAATKQVLYCLCREWEYVHRELVAKRHNAPGGCNDAIKAYMDGLEYHMSGNELWSRTTKRYQEVLA